MRELLAAACEPECLAVKHRRNCVRRPEREKHDDDDDDVVEAPRRKEEPRDTRLFASGKNPRDIPREKEEEKDRERERGKGRERGSASDNYLRRPVYI